MRRKTDQSVDLELLAVGRDRIRHRASPVVATALLLQHAGAARQTELGTKALLDLGHVRSEAVLELDVEQTEDGRRIGCVVRPSDNATVPQGDLALVDEAQEL